MLRAFARIAPCAALAVVSCASEDWEFRDDFGPSGEIAVKDYKGRSVADFLCDAVYTGDGGGVAGVRWVHKVHGMPVTVLRIQSVPQVFLAFNTPPDSDRGEPHTGEHLLLGKGTKGKMLSSEQEMSLVESTAWTSQTDVCYSWSCAAGKDTFYRSVEQYLDALLLPDFTDEEIRREVCHIGPVKDRATGKLSVDEKGTIYQEMVSTFEKRWNVWNEMQKRLWGPAHPLSYSSGGEPSAVRTVEPHHVRDFHRAHYHLGADTEMIVALPDSVPEAEFLTKLSAQMAAVDARPELKARSKATHSIPPGRPEADRSTRLYPYPNANESDGGMVLLMWPPVPLGTQYDRALGELFLATVGNGETATLYKHLMDTATRDVEVDAAELGASLDASKIDLLPNVYLDGVPPRNCTAAPLAKIVGVVHDEFARVAGLVPASDALKAFNEKALVKLAEREKGLRRQLNAPPLFGHRGAGGFWLEHLRLLDQDHGFERSVALAPVFEKIRAELASGANPWTKCIAQLGLDEAPFVGASVASKAELEKRTTDHAKRVEGYIADIAKRYGGDAQSALAKFSAEYDEKTAALDAIEKGLPKPHLVADAPLVPDPSIHLEPVEAGGVKGYRGVFDNMTFVETAVSFRVSTDDDDLPWLAILPQLLTDSGVVIDGKPLAYDEASERRSKEIYSLSASYSMRPSRGRHELTIAGRGADLAEALRAVDWIEMSLDHAWLAPENLARLRDIVGQEIQATRVRLGGAEESWVNDPARAVRWQADPVFLATSSLHARLLLLARCEWRLMERPTGDAAVRVANGLRELSGAAGPDVQRTSALIESIVAEWRAAGETKAASWLVPIGQRFKEMVADMAPSTIAADLKSLATTCLDDLLTRSTGEKLEALRSFIQRTRSASHARFTMTGSRAQTDQVLPRLAALFGGAAAAPESDAKATANGRRAIDERIREHDAGAENPVFYGLVHDRGTSGVFVYSADAGGLDDVDDAQLAKELAGRVFGGQGPQGFFMKTWGAGLAYSNGLGVNPNEGRISYYAERCAELVQTMSFVTGLVRDSGSLDDPYLAEYCAANAVTQSRASDEYEQRTQAAAADMVDGDTPERIARFRKAVLDFKSRPDAWAVMKPQIAPSVGRVLPGIDPKARDSKGGVFVTIAPEAMLARFETYVREQEGSDDRVVRVYGRDFWMPK